MKTSILLYIGLGTMQCKRIQAEDIFKDETLTDDDSADDDNECVVCQDKAPNIVFIPWNHLKVRSQCQILFLRAPKSTTDYSSENYPSIYINIYLNFFK